MQNALYEKKSQQQSLEEVYIKYFEKYRKGTGVSSTNGKQFKKFNIYNDSKAIYSANSWR